EAERRIVGIAVSPAPVWMIQHIESLDAELQLMCLGDGKVLAQPDVEIPDAGVAQAVARLTPEGPRSRSHPHGILPRSTPPRSPVGQLYTRVEPGRRLAEARLPSVGLSDQIPKLRAATRPHAGEVITRADRERAAGLVLVDA